MLDKKTEHDIKSIKAFLEIWMKFHSLYNDMMVKGTISKDDEDKFLSTKGSIGSKYEELKSSLGTRYMPHSRLTDPVSEVLGLTSLRFISEKNLKKLNDDWKDSYIFLNNILERLENNRRRMEQFNPVGVFFKRIIERR